MHCPSCGRALDNVREFAPWWATLVKCAVCRDAYLVVAGINAAWPPLLPLHDRRAEKVLAGAAIADLAAAFDRIERIDQQTLSLLAFENALIAMYRDRPAPGG